MKTSPAASPPPLLEGEALFHINNFLFVEGLSLPLEGGGPQSGGRSNKLPPLYIRSAPPSRGRLVNHLGRETDLKSL